VKKTCSTLAVSSVKCRWISLLCLHTSIHHSVPSLPFTRAIIHTWPGEADAQPVAYTLTDLPWWCTTCNQPALGSDSSILK